MKRVSGLIGFVLLSAFVRRVARSKFVTAVCYVLISDWVLLNRPKKVRR